MRVAIIFTNIFVLCSSKALNGESKQDFDVVCPESQDGYSVFVPHPTDCTLYYQCFGTSPILMSCPEGLFFDSTLDVCNWPDQVDCKQQTDAPETTTTEEETTTVEEETTTAEVETTTVEEETTTVVEETTTVVEETTTASSCQDGWVSHQNMCYRFISSRKTAEEANTYCKSLSSEASLVSVHDSETNSFINSMGKGKKFWIGGFRVQDDVNIWAWKDGSAWDFDNWARNEPNNAGGNENYVMMNHHQEESSWNDEDGFMRFPFICQQKPIFSCESGWVASQNRKCYQYISNPMPAADANNYCKGLSKEGSLASIHDMETNLLLNSLANERTVWLGGYRVEDGEDIWAWTDGSQWDFDSWHKNEPNDKNGGEDFLAMNWGGQPKTTWNDYYGHKSFPFICQQ